ncbi:hypothetical protein Q7O_001542 [Pectobacterium carotovorum subsp. carotovorum PCCS1]|nr:hypothetical protein [Pectobacterium carotovorum subsp. carotovorum PCCS1]
MARIRLVSPYGARYLPSRYIFVTNITKMLKSNFISATIKNVMNITLN